MDDVPVIPENDHYAWLSPVFGYLRKPIRRLHSFMFPTNQRSKIYLLYKNATTIAGMERHRREI